jgi:hypothetical protein
VYLDVISHNKEGFGGTITITAEDLPKGLHCAPTIVNNDNRGVLVLWADKDAAEWVGPIKLTATGKSGDAAPIVRAVRPYTRVWNSTDLNSSRPTRELVVAIAGEAAPFALTPATEKIEVEAGKKIDLQLKCERLWPEVKGNVNIIPLSLPNPFKMAPVTLAESKSEATVALEVQANARPGEYTITFTGQAQVPFAKDPKATARPNTLVPMPSRPLTVVVLPAKK